MRDIYVRHRPRCRYAEPDFKDSKRRLARNIFGCGCPIYARVAILDPVTKDVLFQHNGSLKGITAKEAAEELVNNWFVKYLSGETPAAHNQTPSITVREAVERYIAEKRDQLEPAEAIKVSEAVVKFKARTNETADQDSLTIRKLRYLLIPMVSFLEAKQVEHLKDVKAEHLIEFQATWKGKKATDTDGNVSFAPPAQITKQKNQEYVKSFFKRGRVLGWIDTNPAELLKSFKVGDSDVKVFSEEEKTRILAAIPTTFPKSAEIVKAFVLVLRYAALRISDVVGLEVESLRDGGVLVKAQRKTDNPVFCALPPFVIKALRAFPSKSKEYFFWSGNGEIQSWCRHWSATMLKLFRSAGIDRKRSHNWRDTLAIEILEDDEGRLEDAQIALGHKSRKTTEKYYTAITKKRTERVTALTSGDTSKPASWGHSKTGQLSASRTAIVLPYR